MAHFLSSERAREEILQNESLQAQLAAQLPSRPPGMGPFGSPFGQPGMLGDHMSSPFSAAGLPGMSHSLAAMQGQLPQLPPYLSKDLNGPLGPMLSMSLNPEMGPYSPYYYGYGDLNNRRKNATRETTATLKAWLYEHRKNPYPTKGEKIMLAIITKMTLTQVSTWFANARRRLKKENKMTWSPKNRPCEDDEDPGSSKNRDNAKTPDTTMSPQSSTVNNQSDCEQDPDVDIENPNSIDYTDKALDEKEEKKPTVEITKKAPEEKSPNEPEKPSLSSPSKPTKPKIWSIADVVTSKSPPTPRMHPHPMGHLPLQPFPYNFHYLQSMALLQNAVPHGLPNKHPYS